MRTDGAGDDNPRANNGTRSDLILLDGAAEEDEDEEEEDDE